MENDFVSRKEVLSELKRIFEKFPECDAMYFELEEAFENLK